MQRQRKTTKMGHAHKEIIYDSVVPYASKKIGCPPGWVRCLFWPGKCLKDEKWAIFDGLCELLSKELDFAKKGMSGEPKFNKKLMRYLNGHSI